MCVVQIGELVSQLSDETKAQNKAIPWRIIKDTRNFYVHAYGAIDIPSVWDTLINDIKVPPVLFVDAHIEVVYHVFK